MTCSTRRARRAGGCGHRPHRGRRGRADVDRRAAARRRLRPRPRRGGALAEPARPAAAGRGRRQGVRRRLVGVLGRGHHAGDAGARCELTVRRSVVVTVDQRGDGHADRLGARARHVPAASGCSSSSSTSRSRCRRSSPAWCCSAVYGADSPVGIDLLGTRSARSCSRCCSSRCRSSSASVQPVLHRARRRGRAGGGAASAPARGRRSGASCCRCCCPRSRPAPRWRSPARWASTARCC